MITASHNPPEDNGYKLYALDGAQIIPPDDEIVERYASAAAASLCETDQQRVTPTCRLRPSRRIGSTCSSALGWRKSNLAITYTPLHGVGGEVTTSLLRDAGYRRVLPSSDSSRLTRRFPRCRFPTPKSRGRLTSRSRQRTWWRRRSSSRTTPTPTGWGRRCVTATAGESCAATRLVGCSPPRCWKGSRRTMRPSRRPSSHRRCSNVSHANTGFSTRRRLTGFQVDRSRGGRWCARFRVRRGPRIRG